MSRHAIVRTIFLMIASAAIGIHSSSGQVRVTTIVPAAPYETVGIVTEVAPVSSAMFDLSKPWREALERLTPELSRQARVLGADTVVVTSFQYLPGGGGSGNLVVFGTAVRTKGGSVASPQSGSAAGTASATPSGPTLAGTWKGSVVEEGDDEQVPIVVNLMAGDAPAKYYGGLQAPSKNCEMALDFYSVEGKLTVFVPSAKKGSRCNSWHGQTAVLNADGKLEWGIHTSSPDKPKFKGVLSRQ